MKRRIRIIPSRSLSRYPHKVHIHFTPRSQILNKDGRYQYHLLPNLLAIRQFPSSNRPIPHSHRHNTSPPRPCSDRFNLDDHGCDWTLISDAHAELKNTDEVPFNWSPIEVRSIQLSLVIVVWILFDQSPPQDAPNEKGTRPLGLAKYPQAMHATTSHNYHFPFRKVAMKMRKIIYLSNQLDHPSGRTLARSRNLVLRWSSRKWTFGEIVGEPFSRCG
jgi:hypothetical protein